jgi:hypothetical protein
MTRVRHLSAHLVSGTGHKFKNGCCGSDAGSKALQEEKKKKNKSAKKGTKKIPLIEPEKKNRKRNGDMGD